MDFLPLDSTGSPMNRGLMGTTAIRQLLMSLCHGSQWEYAVFWKRIQHQSQMFLIWEDGYCSYPKPRQPVECMLENTCFNEISDITSFECQSSIYHGNAAGYSIGSALASMSHLVHSLGEGLVGRVASTGEHCWISSDEFYSSLFPEYLDEWLLQFEAGIETILFVPMVPFGVLQLGSLEMVTRDPSFIAHIKDMFYALQLVPGASVPFTDCWDLPDQVLLSQNSVLENLAEPPYTNYTISNLIQPVLPVKRVHSKPDGNVWGSEVGAVSEILAEASFPQGQFSNTCHLEKLSGNVSEFSCQEEESAFAFETDTNMNPWSSNDMAEQPFGAEINKDIDFDSVYGFLNIPTDLELQNAIGPNFLEMCNEYPRDTNIAGEEVNCSSTLVCHTDLTGGLEQSVGNSNGYSIKRSAEEILMDAVVFNGYNASVDTPSNRSNHVRSPTTTSRQLDASCQTQSQSGCSIFEVDDLGPWSYKKPAFASKQTKNFGKSPSESSFQSMISTVIDEENQKKGCDVLHSKRGAKMPHLGKRKSRFGDVQRPRPRDRQMIQDRVKELRELVPNGAKCSIDSLLDRTVKHMTFLRSVTNQAEKLKQRLNRKVVGKRNWSETQGQQNTRSWSFGLGRQLEICPIIVEDLEHPGHMLIEVLCEEHKLFLEIAQILRNLELTILRGAMENHSDKTWAHFIVEVSGGFDRMDIFWPLMQLLQRSSPIPSMF